jgi:hypothetical protein
VAVTFDQKAFLTNAKLRLSKSRPGFTWDDFADLVKIEPRAFKTYRMPEASSDFRRMPQIVKSTIEALLEKPKAPKSVQPDLDGRPLLIPALAGLVVRLARASLIDGRMIAGVTRYPGLPVGLSPEDRVAMAAVSRVCLVNNLPDRGAEIHDLLWWCTQPFEQWLNVPEVIDAGLAKTNFIHAEDGIPTAEAEELASSFSSMTAGLEEQLFLKFLELLGKQPSALAERYYTAVRKFVVSHPICTSEELQSFATDLPVQIWLLMSQDFYEPVPEGWEINGSIPLCAHCGNAMRLGKAGLLCRTGSCASAENALQDGRAKAADSLRATRGIRQYWIEPGIDELKLYDALCSMGLPAELYPKRDRVDIAVANTGIDLKMYTSPETLGRKFKAKLGGLGYYDRKLLVIPDWMQRNTPSYLERLRAALERDDIGCLTVTGAIEYFRREVTHA